MRRASWLRNPSVVAAVLAGLYVSGCSDDKRIVGPESGHPPPYPALTSPENVLIAMARAYQNKDSTMTKLVYDVNYIGYSIDHTGPYTTGDTLYWNDESRHVSALARSATVTNVVCQLSPGLTRVTDLDDPPGWATIENPIFKLEIDDGPTSYVVPVGSEVMQFKFIPTIPDSTSPTDTTWKIIRWLEVKQ